MCGSGSGTARNRENFGSVMGREDLITPRNKPGIAGGCPDLGENSCSQGSTSRQAHISSEDLKPGEVLGGGTWDGNFSFSTDKIK